MTARDVGDELAAAPLNEAFSTLPRLKVSAFLAGCDEAEFSVVSSATETSPSVLSKAATVLETAGVVAVRKGHVGRRPRTWLSLTPSGRAAFDDHLQALRQLTSLAEDTVGSATHHDG